MENQFIFVCTNVGNEKLLKEEVLNFYPELKFSFSKKGFVTFKNTGVLYDLKSIAQLQLAFSTRIGLFYGKAKSATIKDEIEKVGFDLNEVLIHSFSINTDYIFDAEEVFGPEVNSYSADGKTVVDIMALGDDDLWFGAHTVAAGITRYPNANANLDISVKTLSSGYEKLAQIVHLYSIKIFRGDLWLDFGAAPGGSSQFLLEQGLKVVGIDTAKAHDENLKDRNYKHIRKSVQDLSQEELPDEVRWVHADLNINPKQSIKEVLRLIKKYNKTLKGIIFTVQVVKPDIIKHVEEFEDQFYDWGFHNIISRQVPAHKSEYVILATR